MKRILKTCLGFCGAYLAIVFINLDFSLINMTQEQRVSIMVLGITYSVIYWIIVFFAY